MKKREFIRKEVIRLRFKRKRAYKQIKVIVEKNYLCSISIKTIKRWIKKYKEGWNLKDKSQRPKTIHRKISHLTTERIIILRRKMGWGANKIKIILDKENINISESSIKKIIKQYNLSRGSKMEGQRLKWVRWQREHPDSLWQLDGTQLDDMTWRLPIIDDCSRFCLGIFLFDSMTTKNVLFALEDCIKRHGKPREILTDNGSEFGGNGKGDNEFDRWCKRNQIHHIRSGIHKPTTTGKVERFMIQ